MCGASIRVALLAARRGLHDSSHQPSTKVGLRRLAFGSRRRRRREPAVGSAALRAIAIPCCAPCRGSGSSTRPTGAVLLSSLGTETIWACVSRWSAPECRAPGRGRQLLPPGNDRGTDFQYSLRPDGRWIWSRRLHLRLRLLLGVRGIAGDLHRQRCQGIRKETLRFGMVSARDHARDDPTAASLPCSSEMVACWGRLASRGWRR